MASLSNLKVRAQIAGNSSNVQALGQIVAELCKYVEEVEKKAKDAEQVAKRAKREARK